MSSNTEQIKVLLPEEIKQYIELVAKLSNRSQGAVARDMITKYIELHLYELSPLSSNRTLERMDKPS